MSHGYRGGKFLDVPLKEGPRSTLELEDVTGESRYNLYHHLGVLEDAQLVKSSVSSGRSPSKLQLELGINA